MAKVMTSQDTRAMNKNTCGGIEINLENQNRVRESEIDSESEESLDFCCSRS